MKLPAKFILPFLATTALVLSLLILKAYAQSENDVRRETEPKNETRDEIRNGLWKETVDGKHRELTVFQAHTTDGNYGGKVSNWTAQDSTKSASRVTFDVPSVTFAPAVFASKLTTKDSPIQTGAVRVERSAALPAGGVLNLIQDFNVADVNGTKTRVQKLFDVEEAGVHGHIDFDEKKNRELSVQSAGQGPIRFELPKAIEGQILGFEIEPKTSRLSVQTSNGFSYSFALKDVDGKPTFQLSSKNPIPDGLKSFAARVETYDCGNESDDSSGDAKASDKQTVKFKDQSVY